MPGVAAPGEEWQLNQYNFTAFIAVKSPTDETCFALYLKAVLETVPLAASLTSAWVRLSRSTLVLADFLRRGRHKT